ncbi:MAG TPA: hypothetical protein VF507_00540 [Pyrinomonadaceae bacterium]
MLKYAAASFLLFIGLVEIVLALSGRLREAVMRNSLVRNKRAEAPLLFLAGLSALAMGIGILFYGLYW